MARATKDALEETASELQMTPMIDVTFLLLVFFLCATSFRSLERKLDSHLPEDGIRPEAVEFSRLPTEVGLRIRAGTVRLLFGTQPVSDFAELAARLRGRYRSQEDRKDLPTIIHAEEEVPWQLVVQAMDTACTVGIAQVWLGAPPELTRR